MWQCVCITDSCIHKKNCQLLLRESYQSSDILNHALLRFGRITFDIVQFLRLMWDAQIQKIAQTQLWICVSSISHNKWSIYFSQTHLKNRIIKILPLLIYNWNGKHNIYGYFIWKSKTVSIEKKNHSFICPVNGCLFLFFSLHSLVCELVPCLHWSHLKCKRI